MLPLYAAFDSSPARSANEGLGGSPRPTRAFVVVTDDGAPAASSSPAAPRASPFVAFAFSAFFCLAAMSERGESLAGMSTHASGMPTLSCSRISGNAGRSPGSLCQHRCKSCTAWLGSHVGSLGRLCRNATCTTICTGDESSSQGYFRVMSSHSMTAKLYTSALSSVGSFLRASGAIHSGVPPGDLDPNFAECFSRDMPKSQTLTVQLASTNRLAGFRS
mmetsp:Transcript_12087/g.50601  ORF Transcript_12087/g.50601 Transcript_12087/m.50601 type:complete len:219 (-) Transcript_12087:578-1234(-)